MTDSPTAGCFHCGLAIPSDCTITSRLDGAQRSFCCPGCQAVAEAIYGSGLENFYQYRSQSNKRPDLETLQSNYQAYDLPQLQAEFVVPVQPADSGGQGALSEGLQDLVQAQFLVEGITCAACVWLIEHHLAAIEGVHSARVNATTGRLTMQWQSATIALSALMAAVASIGYSLSPATEDQQQALQQRERRLALMRIGVAGFGMMQVGMVAVAMYAGAEQQWLVYWRWISLLIATPVVLFAAQPFFKAAVRAIKNRHLVMDVPVSLAIGIAYCASVWATLSNTGEVYFDSVSMFTFFLLIGRYLEMSTRHNNRLGMTRLAQLLPLTVTRVATGSDQTDEREIVTLRTLAVGDTLAIAPGETIAADGLVLEGQSQVDESLLTGEAQAVPKATGDSVVAGTMNMESPLLIQVQAVGAATALSAIERLVESALGEKPRQVALADRLASWFVAAILIIAGASGLVWYQIAPQHAFWVVLSILVVTCPCALSLATPTAHAAALSRLRRAGLLVLNSDAFAAMAKVNRVVFDKTGTLTQVRPQVAEVNCTAELEKNRVLAIIAALEQDNKHPIAQAFAPWAGQLQAQDKRTTIGAGVSGKVNGEVYQFGRPDFVSSQSGLQISQWPSGNGTWLLLAGPQAIIAWVRVADQLRPESQVAVADCQTMGAKVSLLSGDNPGAVAVVAEQLHITEAQGAVLPEQKLAQVKRYQGDGDIVMMVGDGVNDVPVLSGADISVAMASATDLAQTQADAVLLSGNLQVLPWAIQFAKQLQRTIAQNLLWALGYNGLALPLAIAGVVPPWAAAIGMSVSSLIVVLNALRLTRA